MNRCDCKTVVYFFESDFGFCVHVLGNEPRFAQNERPSARMGSSDQFLRVSARFPRIAVEYRLCARTNRAHKPSRARTNELPRDA